MIGGTRRSVFYTTIYRSILYIYGGECALQADQEEGDQDLAQKQAISDINEFKRVKTCSDFIRFFTMATGLLNSKRDEQGKQQDEQVYYLMVTDVAKHALKRDGSNFALAHAIGALLHKSFLK